MAKKPYNIHKINIVINNEKLVDIMEGRSMDYTILHDLMVGKYGLDLSYKGFMNLVYNRSTWKLIYAWAISDIIGCDMKEIFEKVELDREEEIEKRKRMNKTYVDNER